MRKAASYLVLLLTCAACSDAADDDKVAGDYPSGAATNARGAGGDADSEEGSADEAVSVAPSMTPATPLPPSATSAAGPGGGVGGLGSASGATIVGGSVAGTAAGGGAAFGGGGAGVAAPGTLGPSATPLAPTPPVVSMPTFPSTMPTPQGGQLTAGAWDDNVNYTRFTEFRTTVALQRPNGLGLMPFTTAEFDASHEKFSKPRAAHQQLDVALVIDTTGSMGDEIAYLQREFTELSSAIESAYPMAMQRWALIVYKDVGDSYVTREFDFRTDLNALRTDLAAQFAGGGGDFPEAPDAAFEKLNAFQWREGAEVARLAFWVADAPHHDNKAMAMATALRATLAKDIHVYPVASSGIDEFTELAMRTSAQITGGRYLFLTNDSGIGGAHKEPSIPCYFVTRLDHAILRMVKIEMSGMHSEPEMAQILRTGGNPQDGACKLASGTEVEIF